MIVRGMKPHQTEHGVVLRLVGSVVLTLCVAGAGCSGRGPTVPLAGEVVFDGRPLVGGGVIRFVPLAAAGSNDQAAFGVIDTEGRFAVGTSAKHDGVTAGEHRVEVVQNTVAAGDPSGVSLEKGGTIDPAAAPREIPPHQRISQSYGGPDSPLRLTVAGADDQVRIELTRIAEPTSAPMEPSGSRSK